MQTIGNITTWLMSIHVFSWKFKTEEMSSYTLVNTISKLRHKPEGHRYGSWWSRWDFSLTSFSTFTLTLESSQPLTEISTRGISWRGKDGQCVGLTNFPLSCADCPEIQRASISWSTKDLSTVSFSFTVSIRWTLNNTWLNINYVPYSR